MEKVPCSVCRKKTNKECGLCHEPSCKTCAHSIGTSFFKFLEPLPEELTHGYYCHQCFIEHVSVEYDSYSEILGRAKGMDVYFKKKHSKEIRYFKKSRKDIIITDYDDYDEMIFKMAFLAAKDGFNTIINFEASSRKIHDGSYTILLWSGFCRGATKGR